jgi:3-deoxy-7-phosphoheptulonate synthase
VLLKRGFMATVEEWILAAEHVLSRGNSRVILCERGIRTFESGTRFTLDLNAVALAKRLVALPVIVDPSHGTGRADLVADLARAGVAAGADGLLVEVHPNPDAARSDGFQSLTPAAFAELMHSVRRVAAAVDRRA